MMLFQRPYNSLKILWVLAFVLPAQVSWALDGALTYERFARLNNPANKVELTDWFALELDTDRIAETFDYHLQTDVRYYTHEDVYNYSVQQAFVQYSVGDHEVSLGRKHVDWASHQTYWQLNYLNPQKGFNLLSKEQEGLTGVHYDFRPHEEGIQFSAFASYVYVPSLNPNIDIENGRVTSTSEWQVLPPTRTVVNGSRVPINYKLNMPPLEDIIFQKSLGFNLGYSWGSGKVDSYAIYKPESNVRANAEAFYDLSTKSVQVTANPIVNHHLMFGSSIHQRFRGIYYSLGFDVIDPNARLGKDFEALELDDSRRTFESEFFTVNPSYDRESYGYLRASLDRTYYKLSANYIQLLSSNVRQPDDFFSQTVKFKRAIGLEGIFFPTENIRFRADWKYDFSRKDNILSGEVNFAFLQTMSLALGVELIKAPQNNSYWGPYRDNDTVYGALGYHF